MKTDKQNTSNVPNKGRVHLRFPEFERVWEMRKLGEIGDVKMCKRIFNEQTTPEGEIPFYKIGSFGKKADAYISEKLYLDYRSRFSFPKKGEILISAAGTIGRTVIYNGEDAYFQDSNIVWIENDNSKVTNEFLYYIFQIVKYNTEGGTIQRLYNNILRTTKFECPSLLEQTKIASFLSLIDERITAQSKIIEALRELKASLSKQIFSRKLRFKDEDGNDFPKWVKTELGEVALILMGQSPSSSSYNTDGYGKMLIQGNADISDRKSNPRNWTTEITKECEVGDLILTVRAPVGAIAKSIHSACIGRGVCAIKSKSISNTEYIYQYLLDYESKWVRIEQGSTFTAVSSSDIRSIAVSLPSLQEQKKIADFLSEIDCKIELETTIFELLIKQKQYLLRQMFI